MVSVSHCSQFSSSEPSLHCCCSSHSSSFFTQQPLEHLNVSSPHEVQSVQTKNVFFNNQQILRKFYTVYLAEERSKVNIPSLGSFLVSPGNTADRQFLTRHYLVKFYEILILFEEITWNKYGQKYVGTSI